MDEQRGSTQLKLYYPRGVSALLVSVPSESPCLATSSVQPTQTPLQEILRVDHRITREWWLRTPLSLRVIRPIFYAGFALGVYRLTVMDEPLASKQQV